MSQIRSISDARMKPSRDAHRFADGCYRKAADLDHQCYDYGTDQDREIARLFRFVGRDVDHIADRAKTYEQDVEALMVAVADLLDCGGFAGTEEDARVEARRALRKLAEVWL